MDLPELATLGRKMREAQGKYFRDRGAGYLERAKALERTFDAVVSSILDPSLFPPDARTPGPYEDRA